MKKKIGLLLLLVSGFVNAQETAFTFDSTRGMTDFVITSVEGKTAAEIYKKVFDWIKITYKNPDKVILTTIDNEYVRFEGFSNVCYPVNVPLMGKSYQETKYQIEIYVKEGKYKFDIIGMENYLTPSQYSKGGWIANGTFNGNLDKEYLEKTIFRKDGTLRNYYKYIGDVPTYFNDLNKTIFESITTSGKNNEGW